MTGCGTTYVGRGCMAYSCAASEQLKAKECSMPSHVLLVDASLRTVKVD